MVRARETERLKEIERERDRETEPESRVRDRDRDSQRCSEREAKTTTRQICM